MNKEDTKGQEIERVLRRSRRIRNTVSHQGSGTETESESDREATWGGLTDNEVTVVEQPGGEVESEESGSCFGNFSNTAFFNHEFDKETVKTTTSFQGALDREKRMDREGETVRSKTTDSGLGRTPEPAMGDFMRWMIGGKRTT